MRMKYPKLAKTLIGTLLLVTGIVLGVAASPVFEDLKSIFFGRLLQRVEAPHSAHHAELFERHGFGDMNLIVDVDGRRVYVSPDLMSHVNRETLAWDNTGCIVVLELLTKRVFAYDACSQRELGKGELGRYEFYPGPTDFVGPLKDIDEEDVDLGRRGGHE